ncbi:MAG: phospho-sugar mutase, partial [Spirochaetia bacterium]|nr:phospho-sugar mutase [Spirochaetia bacterium]
KTFGSKGEVRVAIAHDSRNQSDVFARKTAEVMSANGIRVFLFKALRPTPELSFAIRHLKCQGGVVVTASHNPKEYNGYKVYFDDGAQVVNPHDKNIIAEVRKIRSMNEVASAPDESLIVPIGEEIDKAYFEKLKTLSISPEIIRQQKNLSIVYTPIHGAGVTAVPEALRLFGFENVNVLASQSKPDGNFPTVIYPNPEEAEALSLAIAEAEKTGAELVLATDPDTDRVGAAVRDESGKFVLLNGNQTGSLLIYYLIEAWKRAGKLNGNQYIVKTIVTTDLTSEIAKKYGVECLNVLTGFKYIAEVLREREGKKEFIGGGEESYGYLAGDFVRDKDAVSAACLIAELTAWAKDQGRTPFTLLKQIYREFGFYKEGLVSITKKGKSGAEEIVAMMKNLRAQPPKTLAGQKVLRAMDYQNRVEKDLVSGKEKPIHLPASDVLQFALEDGSLITARPSGTEPKIKFYFSVRGELKNEKDYERVNAELDKKIEGIRQELRLN